MAKIILVRWEAARQGQATVIRLVPCLLRCFMAADGRKGLALLCESASGDRNRP